MTISCDRSHLNFSQSRERELEYGLSARLAISPSQPLRQASAKNLSPSRLRWVVKRSGSAELERVAQQPLARAQGQRAHVVAIEPEQVEDVVEDPHPPLPAPGEGLEAGAAPGEGHHLAVHHEARLPLGGQGLGHLGIALVHAQVVAREEPQLPARADGHAPDAVQLALVDPFRDPRSAHP